MKIPALAFLVVVLTACSGDYQDLEERFGATTESTGKLISANSVVITSQTKRGATNYNGIVEIRTTEASIDLKVSAPLTKPISIPKSAISGCSMTCFGPDRWDVDVIIAGTGTDLAIPQSKEIYEWCWANKLPMISSESRRNWQYKGEALPAASTYAEQLRSRKAYDKQARLACQGY